MRRTLTAVACVLLLALCIWLMELVEPVEAPQPTVTPEPTPTPALLIVYPPEDWDGDLEDLYVAIPVDGMEENPDEN